MEALLQPEAKPAGHPSLSLHTPFPPHFLSKQVGLVEALLQPEAKPAGAVAGEHPKAAAAFADAVKTLDTTLSDVRPSTPGGPQLCRRHAFHVGCV